MPFAKGHTKVGGRKKGSVNRETLFKGQFLGEFIAKNEARVQELWEQVAAEKPGLALKLYGELAEFVQPKLGRTELVGKDGGPLKVSFNIDLGGT